MVVLVCGGREYNDRDRLYARMDRLCSVFPFPDITLIHGAARGADHLCDLYARDRGLRCLRFPADWATHGRAAGAIRNQQMLDEGKPDVVIAFPGGKGTEDMIRRARKAGVEVIRVI